MTEQLQTFYTTQQVADALQVKVRTVRYWVQSGKLPAINTGRLWRIRKADLDRFLNRGQINE